MVGSAAAGLATGSTLSQAFGYGASKSQQETAAEDEGTELEFEADEETFDEETFDDSEE